MAVKDLWGADGKGGRALAWLVVFMLFLDGPPLPFLLLLLVV